MIIVHSLFHQGFAQPTLDWALLGFETCLQEQLIICHGLQRQTWSKGFDARRQLALGRDYIARDIA